MVEASAAHPSLPVPRHGWAQKAARRSRRFCGRRRRRHGRPAVWHGRQAAPHDVQLVPQLPELRWLQHREAEVLQLRLQRSRPLFGGDN